MLLGSFMSKKRSIKLFTKRLSITTQILFLKRLARLLERGYVLLDALELLRLDPEHNLVATNIQLLLTNGNSIEEAFEKQYFSKLAISFLYFSKSTGALTESLLLCSEILESQQKSYNQIKKVLKYPLLLFMFLFSLLLLVKNAILPSFQQLFSSMSGIKLPPVIKISTVVINSFFNGTLTFFIMVILSLICFRLIKRYVSQDRMIEMAISLPIYKRFLKRYTTLLFSIHLSSLLKAGNSIQSSLEIIQQQEHQPFLTYATKKLYKQLQQGMTLTESLPTLPLFEPELPLLFKRSFQEGTLETDLSAYAEMLMELIQTRSLRVATWIQPIVFSLFAIVIVLIYLSIILPMFQWMEQI